MSSDASKQVQGSSSKDSDQHEKPKDASASSSDPTLKEQDKPSTESPKDWFTRVTKEGHNVLWPPRTSSRCPTLLTGVRPSDTNGTVGDLSGWERKLETANLERHMQYLRERRFVATVHPLEATAWENGFVPETQGLPRTNLN